MSAILAYAVSRWWRRRNAPQAVALWSEAYNGRRRAKRATMQELGLSARQFRRVRKNAQRHQKGGT